MTVYDISVDGLQIHPEALKTALMSSEALAALQEDIFNNGQIDPITVYRGKVVDGRHRVLVAKALKMKTLKGVKMSNNSTLTDIQSMVHSKEVRRHETAAQLAIRAYNYMRDSADNVTQGEAAIKFGANRKRISEAKKIAEVYNRPDILIVLLNSNKFNTGTTLTPFWTDSLSTIVRWLKEYFDDRSSANLDIPAPRTEATNEEWARARAIFLQSSSDSKLTVECLRTLCNEHLNVTDSNTKVEF